MAEGIVRISFIFFGIGFMAPIQGTLTAMDYFMALFNDEYHPEYIFIMLMNITLLVFNLIMIKYGSSIPLNYKFIVPFATLSILSLITPYVSYYLQKSTAWVVMVIFNLIYGSATGVL